MSMDKSGELPRWNSEIEERLKHFPVHIQTNESIHKTSWHRQPGLEIHVTHVGKGVFVSDGTVLLQRPMDIVIHRGDKPHQLIALSEQTYRRSVVCFEPVIFEGFPYWDEKAWLADKPIQLRSDGKAYTDLIELFGSLKREMADKPAGWEEMSLAHLLKLMVILKRQRLAEDHPSSSSHLQVISQLVQQCMGFVAYHLEESLSLTRVAALFNISEEHLTRCFRKEVGVTFHQFVLAARIDLGKKLLAEAPELSVQEVAHQTGFSSLAHFSSKFKHITGESPTQFRSNKIKI